MPGPASAAGPAAPVRRATTAVALGLLTAIGGLVDVGNLVANPQAGATYGLTLLPLVLVAGVMVALFSEMAGRVAAVTGVSGFEVVVERLPLRLARANLVASVVLTVMTCAAEIGGIGQVAGYLTGTSPRVWSFPTAALLAAAVVGVSFSRAERVLGLAGLSMAVVVVALAGGGAAWPRAGTLVVWPGHHLAALAYLAVAQVGSMLVPYQLVFFASGTLLVGGVVMSFGVDVFTVTDYSLVLSTVVLPFTYWPVWRAARDRGRMGGEASGAVLDAAGALALVLVFVVAVCAVPAMILGS